MRLIFLAIVATIAPFASAQADITVSSQPTKNVTCSGGVCIPTAKKAILNVGDLESLLASGNVTVTTTGSGHVQATNISIDAKLNWAATSTLSLDAYESIVFDKPVAVDGTGGLTLVTNDGGKGGTLSFAEKASVTFANLSSPLAINGNSYTLVNSVKSLASAVAANPDGYFALAGDFDAKADGKYKGSPVATTLNGIFEGLGNTISHLSISGLKGAPYTGFFSQTSSTATIENIRLTGLTMVTRAGKYGYAGGLVSYSAGSLFGDEVAGSISAKTCCIAGGLAAVSGGPVNNCSANVRIIGGMAGGLVGSTYNLVTFSHATGMVQTISGEGGACG